MYNEEKMVAGDNKEIYKTDGGESSHQPRWTDRNDSTIFYRPGHQPGQPIVSLSLSAEAVG